MATVTPRTTNDYLAQRLDGARDLYLLALALGERGGGSGAGTFGPMIQEARIHFAGVIEAARIAGLDTSAISAMLGKLSKKLVASVRPEIWDRLGELLAKRPAKKR